VQGQAVSDILYFTVFRRLSGFTVDSLTIDSIGNLPAGICWESNKTGNTFGAGENGAIQLQGTTIENPGQYKMQVYIQATTNIVSIPFSTLESVARIRYYLRVVCPAGQCPAVDTVLGKDSLIIPYTTQSCYDGISGLNSNLSNLSIIPNPFSSSAVLTFNSDVKGLYTIRMVNLLGAAVSSKSVFVKQGSNEITIGRNGLDAGIYMLSVSDGSGSVNTKVVIE
jgi:hypothetical protein